MLKAIAFCVDELGRVAPFEAAAWIRIYERSLGDWVVVRELSQVRDLDFLAGCLAVVGETIGSRIRAELERSGIGVWELPGEPEDLADVVWREEERLAA